MISANTLNWYISSKVYVFNFLNGMNPVRGRGHGITKTIIVLKGLKNMNKINFAESGKAATCL